MKLSGQDVLANGGRVVVVGKFFGINVLKLIEGRPVIGPVVVVGIVVFHIESGSELFGHAADQAGLTKVAAVLLKGRGEIRFGLHGVQQG